MVTTRAFALRDAGECYACQMLFEGGRFRCRPPFLFLQRHKRKTARTLKSSSPCSFFIQLRQQEANLRWGSQSPLPYRLAMAHRAKQYIIFSGFSQEAPACFLPRGGRSSFMKNFWGFAEKPCQTVAVVVRCGSEVIQGRAGMPPPPGRHRKRCGARLLPGK